MATIKEIEDLDTWKDSRALNKKIYTITRRKVFNEDPDLRRQIRRASVSVMSNIAEGFERNNNNFFINFLTIAKGSAGELRSQLYCCLDGEFITESEFEPLKKEAKLLGERIGKFIKYLEAYQSQPGNVSRTTVKGRTRNT
ncbi:MAG: four helix bundle protein [Flavobacteriales bacterium]|nr:four helix bundle protein [Flavobacteriales bacterium]MCC6937845.1 four helix bundle protein [Flavobacteriales bacterium]